MKVPALLPLALVALLVPTEARRGGFTLPTTSTTTTPKPISCSSVLVKLNPSLYPHCCTPGPWKLDREEAAPECPSGKRYVLTRKTCPGQPGTKTVCEPTIKQKAENFIQSLNLGDNVGNVNTINSARVAYRKLSVQTFNTTRGKRSLSVPCPSSSSEKRICQDILSNSCKGRRSANDPETENQLLADLVQSQDDMYNNRRRRRQSTLPPTERNVYFVVDSSGSIGSSTYQRVLRVLADFATLFCGDASIGMVSFATVIDLEFCPTCLRNLDETAYRQQVSQKIKSARYHAGWTNTGETVKCLSEVLLPSPDCRITTKPTQLVFFTDGRANGCTEVPPALASLTARYPTLETYAIGMGDIKQSGITDLLSDTFDPNNVFNLNNIDELEQLLKQIKDLISGGSLACSPVSFGK